MMDGVELSVIRFKRGIVQGNQSLLTISMSPITIVL